MHREPDIIGDVLIHRDKESTESRGNQTAHPAGHHPGEGYSKSAGLTLSAPARFLTPTRDEWALPADGGAKPPVWGCLRRTTEMAVFVLPLRTSRIGWTATTLYAHKFALSAYRVVGKWSE